MERLAKTRQTAVESYNKSELKVFSQYRAVCRFKFEQQNPGKIARKGYKTSQIMTPRGLRSVVLLPKSKEDEWEVEACEITGSAQTETLDDGAAQLRKTQAKKKFDFAASAGRAVAEDAENNPNADDDVVSKDSSEYEEEGADNMDSDSNSELHEDLMAPQTVSWAVGGASAAPRKPAAAKSAAPGGSSSSSSKRPTAAVAPRPSSKKAKTHALEADAAAGQSLGKQQQQQQPLVSPSGKGRHSILQKHAGKSPEEVLDPMGLSNVRGGVEAVLAALSEHPFTTLAIGEDFAKVSSSCAELKKKAGAAHRNMVNLDIKVSKWKTETSDASQEMKDVLRNWRNKVAGEPGEA